MKVVGQEITRVDAFGKVTGEAKYTADLEPRDILHFLCKWPCKEL